MALFGGLAEVLTRFRPFLECADLSALCYAATPSYSLNIEHLSLDTKAATGRRTPHFVNGYDIAHVMA
jgi:hypothetical protein